MLLVDHIVLPPTQQTLTMVWLPLTRFSPKSREAGDIV